MTRPFSLSKTRAAIRREGLDGWLFYCFQRNDPIAERVLGLDDSRFFTRRWFYYVPRAGSPKKLVHAIEPDALDGLPGGKILYASWRDLHAGLARILEGRPRAAMQYSPRGAVPYISRVDAGTVELVRATGARVVSSGDLVQVLESVLTPAQERRHRRAAAALRETVFEAFRFIRSAVLAGRRAGEGDVQRKILAAYRRRGLVSNAPPIVAVNEHSGLPHYMPPAGRGRPIRRGDWVLLDIWAKEEGSDGVYADITWCGFAGERVPERHEEIFQIVRRARDAAFEKVRRAFAEGRPLRGRDVDRAARSVIEKAGYGKRFTHRTGHSMGAEDHANGANMDGYETREERRVLPGSLFSIEPGVYLPAFGARSEINIFVKGRRAEITGGPPQSRVIPVLGANPDGLL